MAGTSGPFDVEARMAKIAGKPQRVEILSFEDLSEDQLAMIERLRAGAGAGPATADNIPEFFLVAAKHPALFRYQVEGGTMFYNGTIPKRDRELAVLRLAWLCGAPYEWGEHVDIA